MDPRRRFSFWALGLVAATVLVILWGAFVRVTGSGAGCADHWPLCNGELVPRSPKLETLIELTHRVTSSLAGLLSVVVFGLARRRFEPGSPVRRAAAWGLGLMLLEGANPEAIDKALVDFGMAMGPNAVGDLAGLDIGYHVRKEWKDKPDDPRFYRVSDMLAELGRLGQKSGRGFYRYDAGQERQLDPEVVELVRAEAERRGLAIFAPASINSPEGEQLVRELAPDLLVVCDYGQILSADVLGLAPLGGINLHASLLPRYRGAAPIHWALLKGDDETGVTVIHMTPRLDAGAPTPANDTPTPLPISIAAQMATAGR